MSTLNNIRRWWSTHVAWNALSSVITDEREKMSVLNDHTIGGTMDTSTAVLCADNNGARLAVYGYSGKYPYGMSGDEDVWKRIDGKYLPKRADHWVIDVSGSDIPLGRVYYGDTLEAAVEDLMENLFEVDLPHYEHMAEAIRTSLLASEVDDHNEFDGSALVFDITLCNCAGHSYIDLIK